MTNSVPFEVIAAPFTAYLAPVGTAFPAIDAAPGVSWTKVGTSGDLNYLEDGVTVSHEQTVEYFRSLGSTGPRKAFRTAEELMIRFVLADLSPAQYALALNHNTVSDEAAGVGTAGYKTLGLSRGLTIVQRALLVRGPSQAMAVGNAQYEVPIAIQEGKPEVVFRKNAPAALALVWRALEDPDAATEDERFGRLIIQTADAET